MRALKDRYGFFFWLKWILYFAGSFVVAALFWTNLLKYFFGFIDGPELEISWCVAVFGSWFILVIPFMRKKEQIWKRLNIDQEKAVDVSFLATSVFIGALVASCLFWTFRFKEVILTPGLDGTWTKCVFGSWLVALIPFMIHLYRQADHIFRIAEARQTYTPNYQKFFLDPEKRQLPASVVSKIKSQKSVLPGGHVVTLVLKSGEKVPHVFIMKSQEILGVYDRTSISFTGADVVDVLPVENLPVYEESKWLRLDAE